MDGIKQRPRPLARSVRPLRTAASVRSQTDIDRTFRLVKGIGSLAKKHYFAKSKRHVFFYRTFAGLTSCLLLISVFAAAAQPYLNMQPLKLSRAAEELLPAKREKFTNLLKFDAEAQNYTYNGGYTGQVNPESAMNNSGNPRFSATYSKDPSKGVTVTDPLNKIDFTMKPKFPLLEGKQDGNRVIYQLGRANGFMVYTNQVASVKEDIILNTFQKDRMTFDYELDLSNGLEAKLDPSGAIGVYGSSLPINGQVTTGTDQDKELLEKVRQNAAKDKLLFTIPTPFIKESGINTTNTNVFYELDGNKVTVVAENLKDARYPLTIDPSIYIETAVEFMRGNNETNIDFDVSNELIQKGVLTGARIQEWTSSLALPEARWSHGTVVAGGFIYVVGGSNGSTEMSTVYWSRFDPTTYALTSPNPGNGACATWCTDTGYNLPAPRSAAAITTYNGYIYLAGGVGTGTGCGGGLCNTVFYSKLGANGEPNAWATNAVSLPNNAERKNASVLAYNNYFYISGGQTNASLNGTSDVNYAAINPNGSVGAWTSTTVLPGTGNAAKRWGHSFLQYNGYFYIIGGNQDTTIDNKVFYIKANSNGTLASAWIQTTSFTTARQNFGGNFAQIWGGYMYISGGCTAITGQSCTAFTNDLQITNINADGSVSDWTSISGVSFPIPNGGHGFVSWRNTLYVIGGCTAMSSGNCTTPVTTTLYGKINGAAELSPAENENAQPTRGTGSGDVGRAAMGVVINNGYIYNIGGCASDDCTSMNSNTAYAAVNADGSLGAWTVDSTGTLNGASGLGAFGISTYNNAVYVVGGSDGSNYHDSIWRATFNSDGSLGTWTEQNTLLPANYGHAYVITRANNATTGNLYFIGGCSTAGTVGIGCSNGNYRTDVYKCTITNSTGAISACSTTNQLQLSVGVGLMAGIYYAGFIYLAGGADNSGNAQTTTVYFSTINSSGDIVRVDTGNATGGWDTTSSINSPPRRRGVAVGVNGYIYVIGGHDGTPGLEDTLSDIQYAKIDQTTGDLSTFTISNTTIADRWNEGAAAANGYIYIVGGCTSGDPPGSCTAMSGSVQKVQVFNNYNASPAAYTATGNSVYATDRYAAGSTILNGYLYMAGGCTTTTDCTTATNNVSFAPINVNGTIGTWVTNAAYNLPQQLAYGKLVTMGGTLYYIGGQINNSTTGESNVYYSTPNTTTGVPATWATASNVLPAGRTGLAASVWNNRIYILGGSTGGAVQNSVYYSPVLSSGGNITSAWLSTTALPFARSGLTAVAYGANMYILGGFDGTNYSLDVQYIPIESTGVLGTTWIQTEKLPQPVRQADGFAQNGFLYLFGGRSAATTTGCTNNTYVIPINANGSLGYWSQTNVRFNTARYGLNANYYQGKVYLTGGYNCASSSIVTTTDKVLHSTIQFQQHIANYSLYINADLDVFPTKYLANGLDNSDGARWLLSYQSATSGASSLCGNMTTWGQSTNAGAVALGTPGTYTPKNVAGANTNCAQYFFIRLTIDSSNAWGFPEDVSRGPTITDLSLFYSSNPSRRLHHGKTFTDGLLQPLNTPF